MKYLQVHPCIRMAFVESVTSFATSHHRSVCPAADKRLDQHFTCKHIVPIQQCGRRVLSRTLAAKYHSKDSIYHFSDIEQAIRAFQDGRPAMVFDADDREGETDLLYPAEVVTPSVVRKLRVDCGGLVFVALGYEIAEGLGFPIIQDLHTHPSIVKLCPLLEQLVTDDLRYDTRSSFSLWINHRGTFTGITDQDRALTVSRFAAFGAELLAGNIRTGEEGRRAFGCEFRTPGHVPVCRETTDKGCLERRGHTELAVALCELAGRVPMTLGAEMLQSHGDLALTKDEALEYAYKNHIPMVRGQDVIDRYRVFKET
eukprot:Rmarinus@m.23627